MSEETKAKPEVVKWFTRARKFPTLIGRTPDGTKIIGGPYTTTQFIGLGIWLVIAVKTFHLWARFGLAGNVIVFVAISAGLVIGLGKIGSRNPLLFAAGAWGVATAPSVGRVAGSTVQIRRPRRIRHRIVLGYEPGDTVAAGPDAPPPAADTSTSVPYPPTRPPNSREVPAPATAEVEAPRHVLTGVQALLAAHNQEK